MSAALIPIRGNVREPSIELGSAELTIGRDESNRLCIPDAAVSRRHCSIRSEDGHFILRDLESYNGTLVNGATVSEHVLVHGDRISIGDAQLLFVLRGQEFTASATALEYNETQEFTPAIEVASSEHFAGAPAERLLRSLDVLVHIATKIGEIRNAESLAWQLTGMLFDVIPAERAAILVSDAGGELSAAAAWDRTAGPSQSVQVSRSVVDRVRSQRVTILANAAQPDESLRRSKSLAELGIQSVLCAPMLAGDKLVGLIYLDSRDPAATFDHQHVQLLLAIAGIAALALENAARFESLENENEQLRSAINLEHNMVGDSPAMRDLFRMISKVAPRDSTVLILGESGAGKELIARAIHRNSSRSAAPFVPINCAALTETLLESELFGYEKGAFTGALAQKKGRLEAAESGTVFLDEIGELAPSLQAKLLRVLQDHELVRVGGTRQVKIDVRVIAATNRDLAAQVRNGAFREDLYYRLNVVSVRAPSLRERRDDIPLLAQHFVEKYSARCKRRVTGISPEARKALMNYDWPGNVRELENAIERAIVLGSTDLLLPDDLPDAVIESGSASAGEASGYHEAVAEKKRELIIDAVKESRGNYTEAARRLSLHPNYLHRLIRILDLKSTLKKTASS
jgi:Nif-specific regulatory protein